jgi:type I restriction enzyme M protein
MIAFPQPHQWTVAADAVSHAERLDAEHFQPKYQRLAEYITAGGHAARLGDCAAVIRRGRQPRYVPHGSILVINSKHVGRQLLNIEEAERTDEEFYQHTPQARTQLGDVLLNSTGLGSIGRANCVLHSARTVVDNHVTVIRVAAAACDPAYLAAFLNSQLGMMQTEQWLSGSSGQIELYPTAIARFLIHLPPLQVQQDIGQRVRDAYDARVKMMQLMEDVKVSVEGLP